VPPRQNAKAPVARAQDHLRIDVTRHRSGRGDGYPAGAGSQTGKLHGPPLAGANDDDGCTAGEREPRGSPQPGGALDLTRSADGRGGGLVRAFPGRDEGGGGRLPAGSAPARALREDARWARARGEGIPREPRAAGTGGVRSRPLGVLAEVVLSAW